jgi:5-methylcytosine-specific restriction endonuclease McrA
VYEREENYRIPLPRRGRGKLLASPSFRSRQGRVGRLDGNHSCMSLTDGERDDNMIRARGVIKENLWVDLTFECGYCHLSFGSRLDLIRHYESSKHSQQMKHRLI